MMILGKRKGDGVIIGDNSHIANYERGGISSLGSVFPRILKNQDNGTIAIDEIKKQMTHVEDPHIVPITGISLESSHNNCAG